jgi:hypothetical protein
MLNAIFIDDDPNTIPMDIIKTNCNEIIINDNYIRKDAASFFHLAGITKNPIFFIDVSLDHSDPILRNLPTSMDYPGIKILRECQRLYPNAPKVLLSSTYFSSAHDTAKKICNNKIIYIVKTEIDVADQINDFIFIYYSK